MLDFCSDHVNNNNAAFRCGTSCVVNQTSNLCEDKCDNWNLRICANGIVNGKIGLMECGMEMEVKDLGRVVFLTQY
jgi:hypothetical protein